MRCKIIFFILILFLNNSYCIENYKKISDSEKIYKEAYDKICGIWNLSDGLYSDFGDGVFDTTWGLAVYDSMKSIIIDLGLSKPFVGEFNASVGTITFVKKNSDNQFELNINVDWAKPPHNTIMIIKFINDNTIKVIENGKEINDKFIKISKPNSGPIKKYIIEDYTRAAYPNYKYIPIEILEKPKNGSKILISEPKEKILEVIEHKGENWVKVKTQEGVTGWIDMSKGNVMSIYQHVNIKKTYVKTTVDKLRLRDSIGQDSKVIKELKLGEKLKYIVSDDKEIEIDGIKGHWVKVRTEPGEEGFCFDGYLEEVK